MKKYRKTGTMTLVLMLTLVLTGCGSQVPDISQVETSSIYLTKEGTVTAFLVEEFEKEFYSEAELEQMILQEAEDYNSQAQAGEGEILPVKLADIRTRQEQAEEGAAQTGMITVQMEYASAEDYEQFNGETLYLGTIAHAKASGYPIQTDLISISDGSILSKEQAQEMDEKHILVFKDNAPIQVPWKVLYASDGVKIEKQTVTFEGTQSGYAYVIMK